MYRDHWHFLPKTGGLIVAALALIAGAFIVSDFSSVDHAFVERAASNTGHYRSQIDDRIREACTTLPPANQSDCITKQYDAARDYERNEYDVAAQLTMAWWTKIMGVAAVFGLLLSAVGVYLIWETFRETRSTVKAALEANEISDRVAQAELRPYLFVDHINLLEISNQSDQIEIDGDIREVPSNFFAKVEIHLRNYGKVPARKIRVFKRSYLALVHQGRFKKFRSSVIATPVCAPGHERRIFDHLFISKGDREDFDDGFLEYIIRLRFSYEDDRGRSYKECADHRLSGKDLNTFYLLLGPHKIRKAREQWRSHQLDFLEAENFESDEE
jgi:hypothetical protein